MGKAGQYFITLISKRALIIFNNESYIGEKKICREKKSTPC